MHSKQQLLEEESTFIDYLIECGQDKVLLNLTTIESIVSIQLYNSIGVKEFLKETHSFDSIYPGGLKTYVAKCRDLLTKSSQGVNPFHGWIPSVVVLFLLLL